MTEIIENFHQISNRYDAAFVDVWGCMHNGITAYPAAVQAMRDFRARGGKVILVTNAPRGREAVAAQFGRYNLPKDAWDSIATSGDSARAAMYRGIVGNHVYFIGEPHDLSFFDPLKIVENPIPIQRVALENAEGIVCCGPFDPNADPDILRPELLLAKTKGLSLLCANPDIVVDRGAKREWCAGAIAELYTKMGGQSLYFGKPHPPIYELARQRYQALDGAKPEPNIIAIGDGIHTDIQGAIGEDIDSLFVTGGLAAHETQTSDQPNSDRLAAFCESHQLSPRYAIGYLR